MNVFAEVVQRARGSAERHDGLFNVLGAAFFTPIISNDFTLHVVYRALFLSR